MIIYSVTVSIDTEIAADWINWMEQIHIPEVIATGCFQQYDIHQLIFPEPEAGTLTFNIQYTCKNLDELEKYQKEYAPKLQQEHSNRYQGRFAAVRTILRRF